MSEQNVAAGKERVMNHSDLMPFCSVERESLMKPWSLGKYTVATDGRLLVRIPRTDEHPNSHNNISFEELFGYLPAVITHWANLPIIPTPTYEPCGECGGTGKVNEEPCENGTKKCQECNGTRMIPKTTYVDVLGRDFDNHFLSKIEKLPGLSVAVITYPSGSPLYFRFSGGDGLVMPLRCHRPGRVA